MADSQYLTLAEFSDASRTAIPTLRRWIREGILPVLQPAGRGGKILVRASALEAVAKSVIPEIKQAPPAESKQLPGRKPAWLRS